MGLSTLETGAKALQRTKLAEMPEPDRGQIRKLSFRVEERAGVVFVTSDHFPELMVVVKDRGSILPALDVSLRLMLSDPAHHVTLYMNCQRSGDTLDALVEVRT